MTIRVETQKTFDLPSGLIIFHVGPRRQCTLKSRCVDTCTSSSKVQHHARHRRACLDNVAYLGIYDAARLSVRAILGVPALGYMAHILLDARALLVLAIVLRELESAGVVSRLALDVVARSVRVVDIHGRSVRQEGVTIDGGDVCSIMLESLPPEDHSTREVGDTAH